MRYILNREQMRSYDRLATELCKIPSLLLMENAGRGAAEIITRLAAATTAKPQIAIVCGTGNNGGDGFVVARHLCAQNPGVFLIGDSENLSGDARINFEAMQASDIPHTRIHAGDVAGFAAKIQSADLIVDALFGTGLNRTIEGVSAAVIEAINNTNTIRVALDIPSGLDTDRGTVLGQAVRAHHTITFAHPKPGLFTPTGKNYAGLIHAVKLGVPDQKILAATGIYAELIQPAYIAENLAPRNAATYKHKSGDILVIAGSPGKTGAAKLTAEAALRSGAGLTTVCTWREALPAFEKEVREIMLAEIDPAAVVESLSALLTKRSVVVIGPGFGLGEDAKRAVSCVLEAVTSPLVIDADALTICAQNLPALKNSGAVKILTPHAGELARILNTTSAEIEADRFEAARRAAALTAAVVVLKGAHTIVADPSGKMFVSAEANPVLATAGSGDILAGIIAAFAATMPPLAAATTGVFIHAAAANLWSARTKSDRGMLAGDIAALIPEVLGNLPHRRTT